MVWWDLAIEFNRQLLKTSFLKIWSERYKRNVGTQAGPASGAFGEGDLSRLVRVTHCYKYDYMQMERSHIMLESYLL